MLTKTTNLNLIKPDLSDNADITVINANMDLIDSVIALKVNTSQLPTKVSQLTNDSGFISSTGVPVQSVNSKTGTVSLTALDIGAEPTIFTKNSAFNQSFETNPTNIRMNGTPSAGTLNNVAKADHVHQSDTTKANVTDLATTNANGTNVTNSLNTHLADNSKQIPHLGTTTNAGDAYSITTTETIVTNQKFTITLNVASTTAPTLKINTGSVCVIKKANGNNAKLYASTYTLFWNGTNFIQLGEGGDYGTATVDKVLTGSTIGTETGVVAGTMISKVGSATVYTVSTIDQAIARGYTDGALISVKVKGEPALLPANITIGNTIGTVAGTAVVSGSTTFSTAGTFSWIPPLGVISVTVNLNSATGGAGGGGGGCSVATGNIFYTGGTGGNGSAGGVTSFGAYLSAAATGIGYGGSGAYANSNIIYGGAGGSGYAAGSIGNNNYGGAASGNIGGGLGGLGFYVGQDYGPYSIGGGGGGGHYPITNTNQKITITAGVAITITIGAGGAGGAGGTSVTGVVYSSGPGGVGATGYTGSISLTW